MEDLVTRRIKEIRNFNLENTGRQIYIKTMGDAWINPINYRAEELIEFFPKSIHELEEKESNYTIPFNLKR